MTSQKAKRIGTAGSSVAWVLSKKAFFYMKLGVVLTVMATIGMIKILLAIAFTKDEFSDKDDFTSFTKSNPDTFFTDMLRPDDEN